MKKNLIILGTLVAFVALSLFTIVSCSDKNEATEDQTEQEVPETRAPDGFPTCHG